MTAVGGGKATKKFWTRTNTIAGIVLGVIGAITGIIATVDILTRDSTNFSHLEMSIEPVEDSITEWAVPASSISRGDFPEGGACTAEQSEWFAAHAEPLNRRFMLTVRNTASSGPMLALSNFHSNTPGKADRGELVIRALCDPAGFPPVDLFYGKLMSDKPEQVATNVRVKGDGTGQRSPEIPVSFNLDPGESGKIPLELFGKNPAAGKIEYTVYSREEERVETVVGSDFDMPALLFGGDWFLVTTQEGLECRKVEAGILSECTIDDALHEIEIALP